MHGAKGWHLEPLLETDVEYPFEKAREKFSYFQL